MTQSISIQLIPFSGPLGTTLYHEQLLYTMTNAAGQTAYQIASANAQVFSVTGTSVIWHEGVGST